MRKSKFSNHCINDRADRIAFILIKTGTGDPVVSNKSQTDKGACIEELTTEGVLIVRGMTGTVITMYYCSYAQATRVCGNNKVPSQVRNAIHRNHKRGWIEEQNKVRF